MGEIASKFYDSKTFYNLSMLAAPKARCAGCRKWNRRTCLFRYNGKKYCAECTPSDAFNNIGDYQALPPQQTFKDDTPLL